MDTMKMQKTMRFIEKMDKEGRLSKPGDGAGMCAIVMDKDEAFAISQECVINMLPEYYEQKYNAKTIVRDARDVLKGDSREDNQQIIRMTGRIMASKFLKEGMTTELKAEFAKRNGDNDMIYAMYGELFTQLIQYNDSSLACMEVMKKEASFDDDMINMLMEAMITDIKEEIARRDELRKSLEDKFGDMPSGEGIENLLSAFDEHIKEVIASKMSPDKLGISIEDATKMNKEEFLNMIKEIIDKDKN